MMAQQQYQPKKRPIVQKIVIPSGLVKPNETVVIEVPSNLKKHAVVVATRPSGPTRENSAGIGDELDEHRKLEYQPLEAEIEADEVAPGGDEEADPMKEVLETEKAEKELLFKNLIAFHKARRNVISGTQAIISRSFTVDTVDLESQRNARQTGQPVTKRASSQSSKELYCEAAEQIQQYQQPRGDVYYDPNVARQNPSFYNNPQNYQNTNQQNYQNNYQGAYPNTYQ